MTTIDTVVIGAGHAGLAVSRLLTDAGRDHVVLDRGRVGERWRTERWDSLHLLTPNWMTRLPGWATPGPDPDGFSAPARLRPATSSAYADSFGCARRRPGPPCAGRAAAAPGRRIGSSPTAAPGAPATSSSRPARTGRRASRPPAGRPVRGSHRGDQQPLPQPRPARAGRRPRGRRLGVRRADRRRAQPSRARGRPRGRAAHPGAAPLPRPGHLLVARDHRPPGPHHRRGARPGGRAPGTVAAAGRPRRPSGPPRRRPGRLQGAVSA